jgi:predicted nucleic acid-binding protein
LPDEKDEMVLELAVAAQCDYIITYNRKDFQGVEQFGIEVLDPRTFLQQLGVL